MTAYDYYAILGVPRNAGLKDIKHAYRRAARQCHPDLFRQKTKAEYNNAESRFKQINEAHEVLSDPEKRSEYDQFYHRIVALNEAVNIAFGALGGKHGLMVKLDELIREHDFSDGEIQSALKQKTEEMRKAAKSGLKPNNFG